MAEARGRQRDKAVLRWAADNLESHDVYAALLDDDEYENVFEKWQEAQARVSEGQ